MTPSGEENESTPPSASLYRLARLLVRSWLALSFRRIRLQRGGEVAEYGPVILLASHPASFIDALVLVAAFHRRVRCVVPRSGIHGPLRALLARSLGMVPLEDGPDAWSAINGFCLQILADGGALALFVDLRGRAPGGAVEDWGFVQPAAALALQAEAQGGEDGIGLKLYPLHLFLPIEHSNARELRVYVDRPLAAADYAPGAAADFPKATERLAGTLAARCRANPFRLQEQDLKDFLHTVEEVLRADLEEDWATRGDWKQKAEGFELSGFVERWAAQLNYLHPGKLVALREALNDFRESGRKWSLWKFEVENASAWIGSPLRRAAAWAETVTGFAIALFGLVNHLAILLIFAAANALKKAGRLDVRTTWVARVLGVLGCYLVQIWMCNQLLGRRAAGYYAPLLPLSGAYLWRYAWLLRHRTRLAFLRWVLETRAGGVRRARERFVHGLDSALAAHADLLQVPH